ncbi:unnamed protein product [Rhizophagus irregularis]|uniref:Uncharacterized protein n=1 Tax=Rhizophagus irregularis TaxID=588596 RepID=A0A915ZPE3_9GLOM|nr:unnamed protein product [Rhizophagus irregularis]CAB5384452.1 unnamed protein product [Rhizophagus irregularis]
MISYYFKRYEFARSVSDSGNNQHPFISASYNLQDTPVSSHEKQESSTTPSENVSQSPYFQSQPTVNNLCVQPDSSANLKTQPVHPTVFFFRPPNDYYYLQGNLKRYRCILIK